VRAALLFLLVAAPALADEAPVRPLAGERLDVDGDGTMDDVSVEADGKIVVVRSGHAASQRLASAPWKITKVTLRAGPVEGRRVLDVRADLVSEGAGSLTEVMLLTMDPGGQLAVLWQGVLGPQGRDGEWMRRIIVEPNGVLVYEERPGVERCDGTGTFLYPRRLDVTSRQLQPVALVPSVPKGAVALVPTRTPPAGLDDTSAPTVFRFTGASTQVGDGGSAAGLRIPRELDDGDPTTAWSEGLGGAGRGEFFTALGDGALAPVMALRVIPGDASTKTSFLEANRLKRVLILAGKTDSFVVDFPADPSPAAWWIVLPRPVKATCLSVVIDEVYPGRSVSPPAFGRTAISELAVLTALDGGVAGLAHLTAQVATGGPQAESAARHLQRRGPDGVRALLDALAAPHPREEQARLRLALARTGDPAGAAEVVAAFREQPEVQALRTGLLAMGPGSVAPLAALAADDKASQTARVAAAELLGKHPGAREALVDLLGKGPRAVRTAVTRGLGARREDPAWVMDLAALTDGKDVARDADILRVVGLCLRSGPIPGLSFSYDPHAPYELRYRAAQLLGAASDALGLTAVLRDEKEPAIRQVALEAARDLPGEIVTAALADKDPGVRTAALAALGAAHARELAVPLAKDRWPQVRRAAAEAAGRVCRSPEGAATVAAPLRAAVRDDLDLAVRRTALGAIAGCKLPGAADDLFAVAGDVRAPTALRRYAITLLGASGDKAQATRLLELFRNTRRSSFSSEEEMHVAETAAHALGVLGDRSAVPLLVESASDHTLPSLQAGAIAGLGEMCPPQARQAIANALASSDPGVAAISRRVKLKCGW
jgi:HEAT repeat protein